VCCATPCTPPLLFSSFLYDHYHQDGAAAVGAGNARRHPALGSPQSAVLLSFVTDTHILTGSPYLLLEFSLSEIV